MSPVWNGRLVLFSTRPRSHIWALRNKFFVKVNCGGVLVFFFSSSDLMCDAATTFHYPSSLSKRERLILTRWCSPRTVWEWPNRYKITSPDFSPCAQRGTSCRRILLLEVCLALSARAYSSSRVLLTRKFCSMCSAFHPSRVTYHCARHARQPPAIFTSFFDLPSQTLSTSNNMIETPACPH